MAYVWQRWMVEEYRAAGLDVREIENWRNRGRPASTGHFNPRGPETVHHTGATSSPANPSPALRTLIVGRPDLPGPLCQKATGHNGEVYLIAAGRANHAGRIGKTGALGMPYGWDGNALALGNEVETNGRQALTQAQIESIAIQNAVDLTHFGLTDPEWVHRHADISGSGKWDLGSRSTIALREDTRRAIIELTEDGMPSDQRIRELVEEGVREATPALVEALLNTKLSYSDGKSIRVGQAIKQAGNAPGVTRSELDAGLNAVVERVVRELRGGE